MVFDLLNNNEIKNSKSPVTFSLFNVLFTFSKPSVLKFLSSPHLGYPLSQYIYWHVNSNSLDLFPGLSPHCNGSDCGYSSSMEGSETGSREGSDVACTEGICNHDEHGRFRLSFPIISATWLS